MRNPVKLSIKMINSLGIALRLDRFHKKEIMVSLKINLNFVIIC